MRNFLILRLKKQLKYVKLDYQSITTDSHSTNNIFFSSAAMMLKCWKWLWVRSYSFTNFWQVLGLSQDDSLNATEGGVKPPGEPTS